LYIDGIGLISFGRSQTPGTTGTTERDVKHTERLDSNEASYTELFENECARYGNECFGKWSANKHC
jgi:hypothetical protein